MLYVTAYRYAYATDEEWQAGVRAVEEAVREYAGPVFASWPTEGPLGEKQIVVGAAHERADLGALQDALMEAWMKHRVLFYVEVGHRTPRNALVGSLD